ncbi:MAG: enolase C-terminal domain-like protein [Chloroflexota bacterium]|nr:enolase C-terminal domain-like protein [Chloroflexota bacterium]
MPTYPIITGIDVYEFWFEVKDMAPNPDSGSIVYTPGHNLKATHFALKVHTDQGITGDYQGYPLLDAMAIRLFAHRLIGKNALERERIYNDVKRAMRAFSRVGMGIVDIALWDIAGKYFNAPIWRLLGGHPKRLPAYASTYHGDETNGGLNSPEAYADFAEQCLEMGYPAYKIHGWENGLIRREIENIKTVAERVGGKMQLMLDPACAYETFADAVLVGHACDDARFFWYEDPFKDGGISQFAHRRLRQLIRTPLLQCEHHRGLEPHVDFALGDATDLVRGDPEYDGGITGVMKLAHACEGLGLDLEIHGPGPAKRHCMASIRNTNYYEMSLVHPKGGFYGPPVYRSDYQDGLDAISKDGCVPVPEGPGLGVEYDWDYIEKHAAGFVTYK